MIWLNGERLDGPVAPFDLRDRGLLLGDGVFDTCLVLNGKVAFGEAHAARLLAHAAALGIGVDEGVVRAAYAQAATLEGPHAMRVSVTRGPGPRGLPIPATSAPNVIAAAAPTSGLVYQPVALLSSAIRRNDQSPTSRLKHLAFLDHVLAMDAAVKAGADDALMLNTRGAVACAAAANVFAVIGRELVTPRIEDGAMPGVTRAFLLKIAREAGLAPVERTLHPEELRSADAVFLSSSLRLLAPVRSLDGEALDRRAAGDLDRLSELLAAQIIIECGADPRLSTPAEPRLPFGTVTMTRDPAGGRDAFLACIRRGPAIMGILNVTPDSFSDGGRFDTIENALEQARRMVAEGADVIDVGGESTRPGAAPVSEAEERARVLPVIEALAADCPVPISVDTYKASVARDAVAAGASIINDVWGFQKDPAMPAAVAETGAAAIAMYNRPVADPERDVIADMRGYLARSLALAEAAGAPRERLLLDPGIGFGKTWEQSV